MTKIDGRRSSTLRLPKDVNVPMDFVSRYFKARYQALVASSRDLAAMLGENMVDYIGQALNDEREAQPVLKRSLASIHFTLIDIKAGARENFLTLEIIERFRYRTASGKDASETVGVRRHILDLKQDADWRVVNHAIMPLSPSELQDSRIARLAETSGDFKVIPRLKFSSASWWKLGLVTAFLIALATMVVLWSAPRQHLVEISLYTGKERFRTRFFLITLSSGERDTELYGWVVAHNGGTKKQLWRPWEGYQKPAFGDKRKIHPNSEARAAIELLEAIRRSGKATGGLQDEWLQRYQHIISLMEEADEQGTVLGADTYAKAIALRRTLFQDLSKKDKR